MANVRVDGPIGRLYWGSPRGVGRLNLRTSQAPKYADFRPGYGLACGTGYLVNGQHVISGLSGNELLALAVSGSSEGLHEGRAISAEMTQRAGRAAEPFRIERADLVNAAGRPIGH